MTSQKLYEALQLMVDLDAKLRLQASLNQIKENLTNLVGNPATAQYQTNLASALATFSAGAKQLRTEISPSQFGTIAELGGAEFFDPSIEDKIRDSIERNAITPSVASSFVADIATRREAFLQTVRATLEGLKNLLSAERPEADLAPGAAAFIIPRDLFENQLGKFAKELSFISQMMKDMNEALPGETKPVELEYLSSSIPTVAIAAGLPLLKLLATVIGLFLSTWKTVEEIRELRERLTKVGVSGAAAEELTETITTKVEEVVEESTSLAIQTYAGDAARRNELENALRMDMRRLFGQIELGLNVEIRTNEPAKADPDHAADIAAIAGLTQGFVFPVAAKEPLLLTSSEILEGEVSSKKVTTTTRTTIRRGSTRTHPAE